MTADKDARFWDRAAKRYARARIGDPGGYERTIERTRALLGPRDRVLELGCGTGSTALRLGGGAGSYLATDISGRMIAIAEEKHAAHPLPGLSFRTATADDLAAEGAGFDAVLGFNYLHLVRDPAGTLRRIRALLVPGGLLVTKTPCIGDMNPLVRRVLIPAMRAVGLAPHVSAFGAGDLTALVAEAGLDILATESHATKGRDIRPFILARRP